VVGDKFIGDDTVVTQCCAMGRIEYTVLYLCPAKIDWFEELLETHE
jgi:hypothetical protein